MIMPRIDFTDNQVRYRIREPKLFKKDSFLTFDAGRKGHFQIVSGILKSTGKRVPQSARISRDDYDAGERIKIVDGKPKLVKK
jgi:hypothetical protein